MHYKQFFLIAQQKRFIFRVENGPFKSLLKFCIEFLIHSSVSLI